MSTLVSEPNRPDTALDDLRLTGEVAQALRATVFSSGLSIAPRQINDLASQFVQRLLAYLASPDDAATCQYGKKLAADGLGPRSALFATEAARRFVRIHAIHSAEMTESTAAFCNALLEGFIDGRSERQLQAQEHVHQAYLAALEEGSVLPRRAEPLA